MEEIWKDIQGYNGIYQVSNIGRVRSLDRIITYSNGVRVNTKGKILNGYKKKNGYLQVDLYKNNVKKKYYIHRLVLMAFSPCENMQELEVNHKDENKENNALDNLEWCKHKYNCDYGTRNEKVSNGSKGKEGLKGENHPMYGKHHSEETRKKLSEANKGENNPFYGKHHTEETKKKISGAKTKHIA